MGERPFCALNCTEYVSRTQIHLHVSVCFYVCKRFLGCVYVFTMRCYLYYVSVNQRHHLSAVQVLSAMSLCMVTWYSSSLSHRCFSMFFHLWLHVFNHAYASPLKHFTKHHHHCQVYCSALVKFDWFGWWWLRGFFFYTSNTRFLSIKLTTPPLLHLSHQHYIKSELCASCDQIALTNSDKAACSHCRKPLVMVFGKYASRELYATISVYYCTPKFPQHSSSNEPTICTGRMPVQQTA